ncbi:MAG: protein kinase domain-containing protein [Planctomycetota bacterium]
MTNFYPSSSVGPTDVGPYRLVRMIGEGGMGAVYYALRRTDNLAVALKILPRSLAMDNDQLARFRREAAVAMGLDHPNVVGCIDVDQSDGYNFMVMEFVGGGDAEELLRRSGGRISERRAMSIALDITKALHHASSFGLVHRDIKPENLLFTESGMAKLTDFGLVKRTAENLRITERGKAMGTPHFMAPEQARGKRDLDVRSDIYSLGATIYYLLSGRTPYNGNSAFEIVSQLASEPPPPLNGHRPDLSPSCMFIIESMMARELEDRPQSAKDLLVMIEAYFNGRPIPQPRELTKPVERPGGGTDPNVDGRKADHNPMKKLKAAEFQSTPREGRRAEAPGEIPANSITRHFMSSPGRIIARGAAVPAPSPESVSMPSMGTKIPLIRQNAEARKPAGTGSGTAQFTSLQAGSAPPAATAPSASGLRSASANVPSPTRPPPPPQAYPPTGIPMGIPVGSTFPPQAYPPADESGEQLAADLDLPLPQMHFPPTATPGWPAPTPALQEGQGPAGRPALPRAQGRADTAFLRRPPENTGGDDLFESGELLTAEPALPGEAENSPPPAHAAPTTPGPVTARFRIETPPPEAYLASGSVPAPARGAELDAEEPPPEAYIESGDEGGAADANVAAETEATAPSQDQSEHPVEIAATPDEPVAADEQAEAVEARADSAKGVDGPDGPDEFAATTEARAAMEEAVYGNAAAPSGVAAEGSPIAPIAPVAPVAPVDESATSADAEALASSAPAAEAQARDGAAAGDEPAAAAPADATSATDLPADAETTAPRNPTAGSGVATPVVSNEPAQPDLATPREVIHDEALRSSSSSAPAVEYRPPPVATSSSESEPQRAQDVDAASGPQTMGGDFAEAAGGESAASSAAAVADAPEGSGLFGTAAETARPADPTPTGMTSDAAGATAAAAQEDTAFAAGAGSSAASALTAPDSAAEAVAADASEAAAAQPASDHAPAVDAPSPDAAKPVPPTAGEHSGVAETLPMPAAGGWDDGAGAAAAIDPDSLLARVRRLAVTDTIPGASVGAPVTLAGAAPRLAAGASVAPTSLAGRSGPATSDRAAPAGGLSWTSVSIGFVCGVAITILLTLLILGVV